MLNTSDEFWVCTCFSRVYMFVAGTQLCACMETNHSKKEIMFWEVCIFAGFCMYPILTWSWTLICLCLSSGQWILNTKHIEIYLLRSNYNLRNVEQVFLCTAPYELSLICGSVLYVTEANLMLVLGVFISLWVYICPSHSVRILVLCRWP
jgi:hypothetical protein